MANGRLRCPIPLHSHQITRLSIFPARVLAVRASNQRNAGANKGQTATTLPQSCVYRKLGSAISVLKAAENRVWRDGIEALNRAMERGVLVQRCD
jgi:hypothetical protein